MTGEDYFSHTEVFLVTCSSLLRDGAQWFSFFHTSMPILQGLLVSYTICMTWVRFPVFPQSYNRFPGSLECTPILFPTTFHDCSLSFRGSSCVVDVPTGLHTQLPVGVLFILTSCCFLSWSLFQREVYLMRSEIYNFSVDMRYLKCSYGICWFSKVLFVGCLIRPIASLVSCSSLSFYYQAWFSSCWWDLKQVRWLWKLPKYRCNYCTLKMLSCHAGHCCGSWVPHLGR